MENTLYRLAARKGPCAGKIYTVESMMRLGRASTNDIAISDPELSRSHCCFEVREGFLWVVDLASANQTFVNGKAIEETKLEPGDVVVIGASELVVESDTPVSSVDLGFDKPEDESAPAKKKNALRPLLLSILAILLTVLGADWIRGKKPSNPVSADGLSAKTDAPLQIRYEKVEGDVSSIFRYELELSPEGVLRVKIDDLGENERHVRKEKKLEQALVANLAQEIAQSGFFSMEPSLTGFAKPGTLSERTLFAAHGAKARQCKVANRQSPENFRALCERLETFGRNELGLWAAQYSSEKLVELAKDAWAVGQKKYRERDVRRSNLFDSIKACREAVYHLETVNPKPDFYSTLLQECETAEAELESRFKEQRFLADRAINLQEWDAAKRELTALCELIPDREDARHREAARKLLDVEKRMKRGK